MTVTTGNNNNGGEGVTFLGLLTLVFIVFKLTKVIDWSWVWVLAPLWIPALAVAAIAVIIILIGSL